LQQQLASEVLLQCLLYFMPTASCCDKTNYTSAPLISLQDKVALMAANGRFISAPENGGRVYCLSEKAGECEMIQVCCSNFFSKNVCTLDDILVSCQF